MRWSKIWSLHHHLQRWASWSSSQMRVSRILGWPPLLPAWLQASSHSKSPTRPVTTSSLEGIPMKRPPVLSTCSQSFPKTHHVSNVWLWRASHHQSLTLITAPCQLKCQGPKCYEVKNDPVCWPSLTLVFVQAKTCRTLVRSARRHTLRGASGGATSRVTTPRPQSCRASGASPFCLHTRTGRWDELSIVGEHTLHCSLFSSYWFIDFVSQESNCISSKT